MNQKNPFTQHINKFEGSYKDFSSDLKIPIQETLLKSKSDSERQENRLLADLALEKKKYAELELSLINQKMNSIQIVIQNFELKIQKLKSDLSSCNNEIASKKEDVKKLSQEYEDRKKLLVDLN